MIESEFLERICKKMFNEQSYTLTTGFKDLDMMLKGIEKSSIITIGSRTCMGKTSLMTNIMINQLEQNKKCLFFSLDMNKELLIKKLFAQIGELDYQTLNNLSSAFNKKYYEEKLSKLVEKLSKYNLTIFDDIFKIENIKEIIEQDKPETVFIDYLQLIAVPAKKPRTESFEKVMIELKQIAKENDCTIFITSQVSRAVEQRYNKIPMLSDLRESGAIETLSDVVMFLYRDEYYNDNHEKADFITGEANIFIAKNKYGPIGFIDLIFRSSITKFLEPINYEQF